MMFCPDVPARVAINEALELAKRYSTGQSSRFVNGILDRVLQSQSQAQAPKAAREPESAATQPDPPPTGGNPATNQPSPDETL